MNYTLSAWGSLELALKCQKPIGVTILVWHLAAHPKLPGDKGNPEKPRTHGAWRKG